MLDQVRRWAWGLSARLIASYILVTLVAVVLVEALVLGFQVPELVNGAQLQAQVDAAAKSYGQQLAQRYPGGVPAGTVLGDPGQPARPGQARTARDGTLGVPAITGPIHSHQAVTAVVAIAADGTVVASSAPSRYPPGRAAASELPVQATSAIAGGIDKGGSVPTPYGSVVQMLWRASPAGISKPLASAPGRVAYVYVQAPSSPGFINPIRAWGELRQLGEDRPLLAAPFALLFAIVPVGVLFGLLASRRLVRRVRRLERATIAVADGDYAIALPASGRDEIGRLEANFTTMTRQLGSALAAERERATGDARAAERARIAREIHDAISQHLFALRMIAAGMRRADPGNQQAQAIERISEDALRDMAAARYRAAPGKPGRCRARTGPPGDLRGLPRPARRHRRRQPGRRHRSRARRARTATHHPGGMRQRRPARQRPPACRVRGLPGRACRTCRPRHRHRLRPGRPARRLRAGAHP